MEATELKNIQGPLKEKYRADVESALVTLSATGSLGEGISCSVETGKAMSEAGLHPATGGTGLQVCSGDMLLQALVACAGVTLRAVSTSIGVSLKKGEITAKGVLDFRGTLGVAKDAEVGFKSIQLIFDLEGDISDEQRASLAKLTERYCVIFQTLTKGVQIKTQYAVK